MGCFDQELTFYEHFPVFNKLCSFLPKKYIFPNWYCGRLLVWCKESLSGLENFQNNSVVIFLGLPYFHLFWLVYKTQNKGKQSNTSLHRKIKMSNMDPTKLVSIFFLYIYNINAVSLNRTFLWMRLTNWDIGEVHRAFCQFRHCIHMLYTLRYCIGIVRSLHKTITLIHLWKFLNYITILIHSSLDCHFWYVLSTRNQLIDN